MNPSADYQQNIQPGGTNPINSNMAANPADPKQAAGAESKKNQNSTQNTLQISEIRDGIVIMNDGTFRSVIMCKSINFDLMSPQEKEGIEFSYQGFLNSLFFPVQIFIRSQKVDIKPYINKLSVIKAQHQNMLLALLMEDYINFITDVSYEVNIMDKVFYVVIPYFPTGFDVGAIKNASRNFITNVFGSKDQHITINEADLEKAKTQLRNQVQQVINGLSAAGVQSLPLDTQELIELYYDVYNPDTATRQPLKNFNDVATPLVTKGVGEPPNYGGSY